MIRGYNVVNGLCFLWLENALLIEFRYCYNAITSKQLLKLYIHI